MTFALFVLSVLVCLGLPSDHIGWLLVKAVALVPAFITAFELQASAQRAIKALTSARQPSPPPPAQPSAAHSPGTVAQQRP